MNRTQVAVAAVITLVVGLALGIGVGFAVSGGFDGGTAAASQSISPDTSEEPSGSEGAASPDETADDSPSGEPSASPSDAPSASPSTAPSPTPVLFAAPLDGVPVTENLAKRRVIAVMIDDQFEARPQSGLSRASVVWQAPAEGGIPRYMAFFQEQDAPAIGPIRSSRLYFIAWASEWQSAYVHAGGSPQAMALLMSSQGRGSVVYNADALRRSTFSTRVGWRFAPHNLYSDSKRLRKFAKAVGATPYDTVPKPVWTFATDAPLDLRPAGAKLVVPYPANHISYKYDRATNTWLRSVYVEGKQVDRGTKERIAPKNVVVMIVPFIPTGDRYHHLDGQVTGTGTAWFAVNGKIFKGTWSKKDFTAPTFFYDKSGNPVTLAIGQTFVQVVPRGTLLTITKGTIPVSTGTPSPSPSPVP